MKRQTCPWCLRPMATSEDEATFIARGRHWTDDDPTAEALCWSVLDGPCGPSAAPGWWADVTPLEVQQLRQRVAGMMLTEEEAAWFRKKLAGMFGVEP